MAGKREVLDAVERARAARRVGTIVQKTPMEYVALIRQACEEASRDFYNDLGDPPMELMLEIAALAVGCLEKHGCM